MFAWYKQWNRKLGKLLWVLTGLGVLCSVPIAIDRYGTEQTSNTVEFVFDYRDLLEVSSYRSKPSEYMLERLLELREAGIGSMAVYESSLRELELSGRVQTLSSAEAALLTEFEVPANERSTYVLFLGSASERIIRPMVVDAFERLGVSVEPWSFRSLSGVEIAMPKDEAMLQAMDPDPITMAELQQLGFHLVARLSDQRQPFDPDRTARMLDELAAFGANRIVFEGDAVTGAADDASQHSLTAMAELMNEYGFGLATIELSKPQTGFNKAAYLTGYNVVRLHSLPSNMSSMEPEELAARFELAVQDRNIRMIFLNAEASLDSSLGVRKDTIPNLIQSLKGENGALEKIRERGFEIGIAEPFEPAGWLPEGVERLLKAAVVLGAVSLITLMAMQFVPALGLAVFGLGLAGSAGLFVLSSTALSQALTLGVGIAASTLAVIAAIRRTKARAAAGQAGAAGGALRALAMASGISAIGILFVVALLNEIGYLYVLQQYRGVSLLHLAPIALVFGYVLFFDGSDDVPSAIKRIRTFLNMNISVIWVVLAGIAGLAVLYYLSRTGNAGQTSELERMFRAVLQETLGVRPRTKEFLFAHPLFLLGAYFIYTARVRLGALLMSVGVIGQLSIVDTFAHLHTPLAISAIRVLLGLAIGAVIGLVLIACWRLAEKGWKRWGTTWLP